MWFVIVFALAAPGDDILADEAKPGKGPPAAAASKAEPTPQAGARAAENSAAKPGGEESKSAAKKDESGKGAEANQADPAKSEAGKSSETKTWYSDMAGSGAMGYMIQGGIFMWPILVMGVLAFGVIIERFRALLMINVKNEELRGKVHALLHEDEVEEAIALCEREQGPVPAILGAGLRKYVILRRLGYDPAKIEEQVVKGMEDYSVHVVAALERHLPILATISSAAPMIGFLGTVQGMVISFQEINDKSGQAGANIVQLAAGGIMIALLTTVLGLIVGIPAFVAFNYFTSVINRFVLDVEESAADLIEAVTLQLALAGKRQE